MFRVLGVFRGVPGSSGVPVFRVAVFNSCPNGTKPCEVL